MTELKEFSINAEHKTIGKKTEYSLVVYRNKMPFYSMTKTQPIYKNTSNIEKFLKAIEKEYAIKDEKTLRETKGKLINESIHSEDKSEPIKEETPQSFIQEIDWEALTHKIINPALDFIDNKIFYGVYLPTKQFSVDENSLKTIYKPFVITSEREKIPLNLKDNSIDEYRFRTLHAESQSWHLKHIKAYLDGSNTNEVFLETYENVREVFKRFMDLDDEREYDLVTCWTIATYFHQVFNTFPILYLTGTKRAGKTRLLLLLQSLAFNAQSALKQTGANLFRVTQQTRGTLICDEEERFSKEDLDLTSLILARYKKGLSVPRQEEVLMPDGTKGRMTVNYDVFGCLAMANIAGLESETLEDRCISLHLKRSKNRQLMNREPDLRSGEFADLRNALFVQLMSEVVRISNFSEIFSSINEEICKHNDEESEESEENRKNSVIGESVEKIEEYLLKKHKAYNTFIFSSFPNFTTFPKFFSWMGGRNWELWKPLLLTAMLHSSNKFQELVALAQEMVEEKVKGERDFSLDALVVEVLNGVISGSGFYELKLITEEVNRRLYSDFGAEKDVKPKRVSSILRNLGFKERSKTGNRVSVFVSSELIVDIAERLGLDLLEKPKKEVVGIEVSVGSCEVCGLDCERVLDGSRWVCRDCKEKGE